MCLIDILQTTDDRQRTDMTQQEQGQAGKNKTMCGDIIIL
jgi:hypothetical protein